MKFSKLNLALITITIFSIGIAIGVLIKYRVTGQTSVPAEIKTINNSETIAHEDFSDNVSDKNLDVPTDENSSEDVFDKSLDSLETGEFVKKLIREHFQDELLKSSNGNIFKPFGMKVINLPENVDYGTSEYNQSAQSEEIQKIRENIRYFDYETISNVIGNFQLVNCEKGITHSSKIGYKCGFILPSVEGTGLSTKENRVAQNFQVAVVKEDYGYKVAYID